MEVSLAGPAVIMAADEISTVWLLGASLVKHHMGNSHHFSHISLSPDPGFWRGGKRSQRLNNLNTGKIGQLKPLLKTAIQSQAFETEIL